MYTKPRNHTKARNHGGTQLRPCPPATSRPCNLAILTDNTTMYCHDDSDRPNLYRAARKVLYRHKNEIDAASHGCCVGYKCDCAVSLEPVACSVGLIPSPQPPRTQVFPTPYSLVEGRVLIGPSNSQEVPKSQPNCVQGRCDLHLLNIIFRGHCQITHNSNPCAICGVSG